MNKVHKDGRALLTLSRQVDRTTMKDPSSRKDADPKPAPHTGIQRQDTDYDVKPEIPTPAPSKQKSNDRRQAHSASHQYHAAISNVGMVTQMGESESHDNRDAEMTQARMLRSLCS
jgi:hypothetical protein